MIETAQPPHVTESYAKDFPHDDLFAFLQSKDGEVVRAARGRRTFRFEHASKAYFAKVHTGVGWGEILKNILRLRRPVISASNEWRGLQCLPKLGIAVPKLVAYGSLGVNPARLRSFVITEALDNTITLEVLCRQWRDQFPENFKRVLINEIARITRILHEHGMNHRDFYLCHFRIDADVAASACSDSFDGLYLMDLHRVQSRPRVPLRWRVKDLAGLLFSAFDAPMTSRDLLRFAARYRAASPRQARQQDRRLWRRVYRVAARLYRAEHGRPPRNKGLFEPWRVK